MIDMRIRRCVSFLPAMLLAASASGALAQPPDAGNSGAPADTVPIESTEPVFVYHPPAIRIGGDYTVEEGRDVSDVVVVMGNVRIAGHAHRDVVVVFGTAYIDSTAVIDGSLVIVGGHASIGADARIERDLLVFGGSVDAAPGFTPDGEHVVVDPRAFGVDVEALVPWITR